MIELLAGVFSVSFFFFAFICLFSYFKGMLYMFTILTYYFFFALYRLII